MRRRSKKWKSEKQIPSDRVGTRKLRSSPLLGMDGSERAQHPLRPYEGGLQESENRGNEFAVASGDSVTLGARYIGAKRTTRQGDLGIALRCYSGRPAASDSKSPWRRPNLRSTEEPAPRRQVARGIWRISERHAD